VPIDLQKNNFAASSVGDILQYFLLPAALQNEFSEGLYIWLLRVDVTFHQTLIAGVINFGQSQKDSDHQRAENDS
jgi:hypothetical protein